MRTQLLYIIALFFVAQGFGQRKYAANQYFKEYAYVKSAELYEQIFKKGDSSKLVLERLGDSYYYNTNVKNAELWYSKLIKNYPNETTPEYYFKYAQTLKGNGKYDASNLIMNKFKSLKPNDTRYNELAKEPNYISVYSDLNNKSINLHNVSLNTPYSEFGGFISGNTFYFASPNLSPSSKRKLYKWNNQPYLDLYKSTITLKPIDGSSKNVFELLDKELLSKTINTSYHEANAVITKDGSTMYFTRDNPDKFMRNRRTNNAKNLKLYKSSLQNGTWSEAVELPFNNDNYSVGNPTLSTDEKTLYFVSDMPGGIGSTDIYSVSLEGSNYGEPKNLGKTINTEGREMFPFVSSDNVLYFSSDGHLGLGALDIFESKIEENGYSKPKNVKAPFNSKMDDFAFIIDKEKSKGFFSSNREGGKGDDDIYSFIISHPKPCMQNIHGIVTDSRNGEIISMATVKLLDSEGKVINQTTSNSLGAYSFDSSPCEKSYVVLGEKKNYKSDNKSVDTTIEDNLTQNADLALTSLIVDNEIVINPIFFDFNKYDIREEAIYELEKVVTVMKANPDMVIKIESHTDSRGEKRYNLNLSDNRAKSTRDYIISRGIATSRIKSAIGFGESQLLNNCDDVNRNKCTEEEHQRNRRSKFIIVGYKGVKISDPTTVPLKKIDPKPGKN